MNISYIRHIIFLAVALLTSALPSMATAPVLKVSMDSAYVLMGKATPLHIELVTDKDARGNIVIPRDSMCGNVEILSLLDPDSTDIGNGRVQINREMLLQSFDSGMYLLKPILYIDGHDTVRSARLPLKVLPVPVDTLSNIHDYSDVADINRPFLDYIPVPLLWALGILAVGLLIYYLERRFFRKGDAYVKVDVKPVPPYEQAITALNQLRSENLCEKGREKEYYTVLTDILRTYLQRRFNINAMEMTSDQIRRAVLADMEARTGQSQMALVLEVADFVKFAKLRPDPDMNNRAFNSAMQFVEMTKPLPPAAPAENAEPTTKPKAD